MNYIIIGKGYISELVTQINVTVNILSENEFKDSNLTIKTDDIVYAPTESALEIILERSEDSVFTNAVNMLKDKYKFRELMSNLYPDFFFAKTTINELETIELDRSKKYIVKPTKGFFGTAVKVLNKKTNISEITKEIRNELAENSRYFSESVLSKNELIIEQFVEGEEYAVDMYFNENGKPEIMNIYHHPLPEKIAYFNVLYYTNHQIFDKLYD
ncbi:MAG: ATP-grasp domain-containing protein, partial [Candidatus Cloacimonadota bacterium]|nr:ATP-grasp domain-containing protein [Candidatus Cloacimonadota bacterium]